LFGRKKAPKYAKMDDDRDWAHSSEYSRQTEATPMTSFPAGSANRNASSHHLLSNVEGGAAPGAQPLERSQQYSDVDKKEEHVGTA
jgi:hypothetical protein